MGIKEFEEAIDKALEAIEAIVNATEQEMWADRRDAVLGRANGPQEAALEEFAEWFAD